MSRGVLGSLVALWLVASALPAAGNFDCDKAYQSFWGQLNRQKPRDMSRERLASLQRWAQRAYDACLTGDVEDPAALFERLERERY